MKYYKLVDKKVIPCESEQEWMHWLAHCVNGFPKVEHTHINGMIAVSTIFTGMGSFNSNLVFETAIMGEVPENFPRINVKSATWDEAVDNHAVAVLTARQYFARIDRSLGNWSKSNV
jgi:hypothetical protein